MLKHTRISSTLDTARLGNALRGPGMDTRTWVSLAVVAAVHVDAVEGVFADVVLMPSQRRETARLGTLYAGNGFGFHAPVEVDDEVLVEAPDGDPDNGLVITQRVHSPSDPPPGVVVDHPADVLLVVKPGQSVRIAVSGGGSVHLGQAGASRGVARVDDLVAMSQAQALALELQLDARYAVVNPLTHLAGAEVGSIVTASDEVKAS